MEGQNHPVEMISVCDTDGAMTPIRFRYETEDQTYCTAQITEVISIRNIDHVGSEMLVYLCRAQIGGAACLVELKYSVRTHRWRIFRTVC